MRTFSEELTDAHRRGDEDRLNELLDMQVAIKEECVERINAANSAAADLEHQLHALTNLIETARAYDMNIENGDAPLPKLQGAVRALQDWMAWR